MTDLTEHPPAETSPSPHARLHKRRGFAAMDPGLVSAIASRGGTAAHRAGTAHEFTAEEARAAGRKGGLATRLKRKSGSTRPPNGD